MEKLFPRFARFNACVNVQFLCLFDSRYLQEITIELLKDAMLNHPESPGFLIDGFPRELSQGQQFELEVCYAKCPTA